MACRYTFEGKTYEAYEFDDVLRAMSPSVASQYMPFVKAIPDAPFVGKTNAWVSLALKRMMRYAVDNGFDKVAFNLGEANNEFYDLSKQVDSIRYSDYGKDNFYIEGIKDNRILFNKPVTKDELEDVVGKELAQKIIKGEGNDSEVKGKKELTGVDLKVGGEGMRSFYDQIVPQVANDVLKKVGGGRVEKTRFDSDVEDSQHPTADKIARGDLPVSSFTITPEMREKIAGGLPLFSRKDASQTEAEAISIDGIKPIKYTEAEMAIDSAIVNKYGDEGLNYKESDLWSENINTSIELSQWLYPFAEKNKMLVDFIPSSGGSMYFKISNENGYLFTIRVADHASGINFDNEMDIEYDGKTLPNYWIKNELIPQIRSSTNINNGDFNTTNSDIKYANKQTETEAFKRWFGDSKVVDSDGKPLVVYHGTQADFDVFKMPSGKAYFTDNFDLAKEIYGNKVKAVYLNISNPAPSEKMFDFREDGEFDGAIYTKEKWYGFSNVKVFQVERPNQIKSATDNNGDFDSANPDIRYSRADQGEDTNQNSSKEKAFEPALETFTDKLLRALQDKNIDLKQIQKQIKEKVGEIQERFNAYLQEELFHGRVAKRTKDFIEKELNPLINEMRMRKVEMADFEEYLWMRHAPERNAKMAEINEGNPDGLAGVSTAEAKAYMDNLSAQDRKNYEALAKRIDAMNRGTRNTWLQYGLESQSTISAMEKAYQYYVPLMREDMDIGQGNGTGQGYSVKGNASKRATGSRRAVVDIISNIAQARERAIIRGEKNRVATALIGLAKNAPNDDFWKVDTPPKIKTVVKGRTIYEVLYNGSKVQEFTNVDEAFKLIEFEGRQGYTVNAVKQPDSVQEITNPNYKNQDNVIIARIPDKKGNIQERSIVFNQFDERAMKIALSMKNLDVDQLDSFTSTVAIGTRWIASVNTQYNPVFGAYNLWRDAQAVMINLGSTPLAGKQKEVLSHAASALKGIYIDIRDARKGITPNSKWAQLWEEFQREGGQTGYRDQYKDARERSKAIEHALDPDWWMKSKLGKVLTANGYATVPYQYAIDGKYGAKAIFNWLSDYNETLENAMRLSVYKTALDNGQTKQQAASIAKNISVNFNRKGSIGRQAGALYAFFNASMQGSARIYEALVKDGKLSGMGKKVIYGGLLLGAMQALTLALAGFDEDEPPEFIRDRNVVIPIGNGKYLSWALPLGYNVVPAMGRIATEYMLGGFRDAGKHTSHMIEVLMDMFNPIGNAGMSLQTLTPTVADPLVALTENRDWNGQPIYKEDFNSLDPTAGFTRSKDTATMLSKALAYGFNYITGGDDDVAGAFSPTPDQIDFLIGQVTGGVGRELSKVEQTVTAPFSEAELPSYKIPLFGKIYGDAKQSASQGNAYYKNVMEMNRHERKVEAMRERGESVAEYLDDYPEARLLGMMQGAERQIKRLKKARNRLKERGADAEQLKQINDQITEVMKRVNTSIKSAKDGDYEADEAA
jgi:hypothetical protein